MTPRIGLLLSSWYCDVSPDVYLSCVAILYASDPAQAMIDAPPDVTLDALSRVAWWHGFKPTFTIAKRTA